MTGFVKGFGNLMSLLDRFGRNAEEADNKRHGALEVDHGNRKANDNARQSAKNLSSRKHTKLKSNGLRRNDGDNSS